MTTTVRMYQNKGLLPPPRKDGRKAVYDRSHLDRLRLIADLQDRGHSLSGIGDLLDGHQRGEPLSQLLGLRSWAEAEPVALPILELARRLGGDSVDPAVLQRAVAAGLVAFDADGETATVSDRRFLDIGTALADLGVPPSATLDEWELLAGTMSVVAERFVEVFEHNLLPGLAGASVSEVAAVLDRLAGLARDVTVTALDGALRRAAADHLEEI